MMAAKGNRAARAVRRWVPIACLFLVVGTRGAAGGDWVRIGTPHFTVFSEASEGKTREWALQFEIFRHAITAVLPVNPALLDPVTLVLFASERGLRPFKPVENGKPAQISGFFLRVPTRHTIALAVEGARDDVRRVIFHEAVHWHLSAAARTLPRWMDEGLAEVFSSFSISGDLFEVGGPPGDPLRRMRTTPPLPIAELLAVDALQFNGQHTELTNVFYSQSWALMHSLLFDSGEAGLARMAAFLGTPASEQGVARDLETRLQVTPADLERRLATYLQAKWLNVRRFTIDRAAIERGFAAGRAEPGEVDLALGNLLVGLGRWSEAEPYLQRGRERRPHDARGLEALAACALATQRTDAARALLEAAVQRPNATFAGYSKLAEIWSAEIATGAASDVAAAYAETIAHLQQALRLNPRFRPAYEQLVAVARSLPRADPIVGAWLAAGLLQFPESWEIRLGNAIHALKAGNRDSGRAHLEAARRLVPGDRVGAREGIEAMAAVLDLVEKAVPVPAPAP